MLTFISFFISVFGALMLISFSFKLISGPLIPTFIFLSAWTFNFISSKSNPPLFGIWIFGSIISWFISPSNLMPLLFICNSGFKFADDSKLGKFKLFNWILPFLSAFISFPGSFTEKLLFWFAYFCCWGLFELFNKLKLLYILEFWLFLNFILFSGISSAFFSSSFKFILFLIFFIPFLKSPNWLGISILICWSPLLGSISGSLKGGSSSIFKFFSRSIFLLKEGSSIPGKLLFFSSPTLILTLNWFWISKLELVIGILKSYSYLFPLYLFL